MTIRGVAFIMYPVTEMPRAVAFYQDVIGLTKSGIEQPFWVEFDVAGATFGLGTFEQVGTPGTAQSLAIEVDDMAGYRAMLLAHGVESSEPFETPVCWIATLKDPDGNGICLHQSKPDDARSA